MYALLHAPTNTFLACFAGANAHGANAEAHEATRGAHTTNDRVESNFGGYDYVPRRFKGISVEAASAVAQQMRAHAFEQPSAIVSDCRKAKQEQTRRGSGFFYTLPCTMQESLIETCCSLRAASRIEARADLAEQLEYKKMKREEVCANNSI